jgi:FAD:protein FMN transferase
MRCVVAGALGILLCSAVAAENGPSAEQLFKQSHAAMGTVFTISCYAANGAAADAIMRSAFDEVDRLDDLLSNYKPSSELSRISREAAERPVATDPETFSFLRRSFFWSKESGGAFDITVGPLLRAWGFKAHSGHIPDPGEQRALRQEVGWEKVQLNEDERTVHFRDGRPIELDPGSIGKGFAVDAVARELQAEGVRAAMISAGGSTIYALGAPSGEAGWPVEIPDPRTPGAVALRLLLRDTSLSTGACTEKFFIQNGHRFCHIFDPRTLQPVEGVLQSTVITPSATDSDALSTVVFVLPPEESAHVLQAVREVQAVVFFSAPGEASCASFALAVKGCKADLPSPNKKGKLL